MDVSVEKQFKEKKSRKFLYSGIVLFITILVSFFGYLNFAKSATSPSIITYQGKLLNSGVAVTTTQAMSFVLYDDPTAGNALYSAAGTTSSPSTVSTTVNDGFFTIDLGDTGTNAIDPTIFKNNQAVYLKVIIGGETLTPRKRITASPFALNSRYLDGIGSSSTPQSSIYIPVSDNNGNFNFNSATFTSVTTTGSFWTNLLTAATGWFTDLFWNNSTSTGNTYLNTLTTIGNTTLATTTISSSTIGSLNVQNNEYVGGLLSVTGNATFNSSTFNGYVGIGTSTPSEKLQVNGGNIYHNAYGNPTLKSTTGAGNAQQVYVSGKNAFVAAGGSGLQVVDISNPAAPILVSSLATTFASSIFVSGNNAYVADSGSGLKIINISDPNSPVLIGSLSTSNAVGVYVSGKYAYVADGISGVRIIDISNPTAPTLISTLNTSGSATGIYVSGKYAYVADNSAGLQIINVSNPAVPLLESTFGTSMALGVYVSGKYAYLADYSAGLKVIDISSSTAPSLAGSLAVGNDVSIYVAGKYAYLSDDSVGLQVLDISIPTSPSFVGALNIGGSTGVYVSGKYAYLAAGFTGLITADINGLETPTISTGNISTNDLTVSENIDVGNNLSVNNGLNIGLGGMLSNGSVAITVTSTFSTNTIFSAGTNSTSIVFSVNSEGALVSGLLSVTGNSYFNTIASGTWNGSLIGNNYGGTGVDSSGWTGFSRVDGGVWSATSSISLNADISGVLAVANGGTGTSTFSNGGVVFSDGTQLLQDNSNFFWDNTNNRLGLGTSTPASRLQVYGGTLLVDNPVNPSLVGITSTTDIPGTSIVKVIGNYAYVPTDGAFMIFDISKKTTPVLIGSVTSTYFTSSFDMKISGKYAYVIGQVAVYSAYLSVVDISNPYSPVVVSSLFDANFGRCIDISGKYAYIGNIDGASTASINVVDISNPSEMHVANIVTAPTYALSVANHLTVSGRYLYVAAYQDSKFTILDIINPSQPVLMGTVNVPLASITSNIYISGKYAFFINNNSGSYLGIVDVSNPSAPVFVSDGGVYSDFNNGTSIEVSGKYAYLVGGQGYTNGGIGIYDISDVANPVFKKGFGSGSWGRLASIDVVGKYAYIVGNSYSSGSNLSIVDLNGADISAANIGNVFSNELTVSENIEVGNNISIRNGLSVGIGGILSNGTVAISVSNLNSTSSIFSVGTSTPSMLTVMGNGYVGIGTSTPQAKLHVYDGTLLVDSPVNPTQVGTGLMSGTPTIFKSKGNITYVSVIDSIRVFDTSNKNNPVIIGSTFLGPPTYLISMAIVGDYLYATGMYYSTTSTLFVFNISKPAVPTLISQITIDSSANWSGSIYISGKYAYVTKNSSNSVSVFDISNPMGPRLVSNISDPVALPYPGNIYVTGGYAYVTNGGATNEFSIINISDPLNLSVVSTVTSSLFSNGSHSVVVSGRYAYVTGSSGGGTASMVIFDVSNPNIPVFVNSYTFSNTFAPTSLKISGKYAYILKQTGSDGFAVVDISDPLSLKLAGEFFSPSSMGAGLEISGGYAYLINQSTNALDIVKIGGADISSARIGDVSSNFLTVSENVNIGNNLYVNNGLNIGSGGLLSFGAVAITVSTTISTTTLFSVGTSTPTMFTVMGNGYIGIGTSTPSEKVEINGGNVLHTAYGDPTLKGVIDTVDAHKVHISGKYAYVADGAAGFKIMDISNPGLPILTGSIPSGSISRSVYVSGKYAYLADAGAGLKIINISNSASPTLTGTLSVFTDAVNVYVSGRYAYVTDWNVGLKIVDVSNPANPFLVSSIASSGATGVYVTGEYLYIADGANGLKIINISNPHNPIIVNTFDTAGSASNVYVSGKYAYIADWNGGLKIVDISNPAAPSLTGIATTSMAQNIYVSGRYAYLADRSGGLKVFDISTPSSPTLVGTYASADAWDVFISGKYAYVAAGAAGLEIVNINGLETPSISTGNIATNDLTVSENVDIGNNLSIRNGLNIGMGGLFSSGAIAVTVSTTISTTTLFSVGTSTPNMLSVMGNGYVGIGTSTPQAKLHLYGGTLLVDNPVNLTLMGTVPVSNSANSVYVSGKYAYVAAGTAGIAIMDISDPQTPTTTGILQTTSTANSIYVSGKYAYVAENAGSFEIFDISNSSAPTLVDSYSGFSSWVGSGVYVSGKFAYVGFANGASSTFTVFNVSNPKDIQVESVNNLSDTVNDVYVSGKYLYLANGVTYGLTVYDISIPSAPQFIDSTASAGTANGVYVSGRYAYVADKNWDLSIFDVSSPSALGLTKYYRNDNLIVSSTKIFVAGKYAYVANHDYGLKIFDISSSTNPRYISTYDTAGDAKSIFVQGKYAYVADGSNGLVILDVGGADISAANIGNVASNNLTVWENTDIGNNLSVRNSLNVGSGGIFSSGPVSFNVPSTDGNIFSLSTSSASGPIIFRVGADGVVAINTSTISGLGNSYKLVVDSGSSVGGAIGVNGFIRATSYITGTTTLDLAETYPINMLCIANGTCPTDGDVVCSDSTVIAGVKKCIANENNQAIGIVSTNPGFLLGGGDFASPTQIGGSVKVALAGRVPVRVSTVNGVINSGDKLTLSNIDGVAAKAVGEVPVIGIAMENFSGNNIGNIVAFVNLGWQNQLYKALTIDTNTSTLTVGSDITPYNLALSGELTMFNNVLNKLVFNATALFETKTNDSHAFIFNATNFGSTPDKYLLSLRSNNDPRFSVMANGDVRASGNLYAASAVFGTSSNPGDLAERVDIASDDIVEPGDVLVVDMNNPDTYRRSGGPNEQAVAGVVSTNPTIVVGNGKTEYTAVMAMVGRVPLKVSDENGAINRGDLLVTASTSGFAMKYDPKKDNGEKMVGVVGIALDPMVSGKGKIMALVRTGWVNSKYESISSIKDNIQQLATAQGIVLGATSTTNLNIESNNSGQLTYSGGDLNLQGNALLNVTSVVGKNNRWLIDESGHFITKISTSQGEKDMYAIQSPTSEFVFSSSSQLIAGEANIIFDQTMQDIIDPSQPLKINITLTSGEAKGIFVAEKNTTGFTVKELDKGTSSATFDWMVVAKRKEENIILPLVPSQLPETTVTTPAPTPTDLNAPTVDGTVTNSESTVLIIPSPIVPTSEPVIPSIAPEIVVAPVEAPTVVPPAIVEIIPTAQ